MEGKKKRKKAFLGLGLFALIFSFGCWQATQDFARRVEYNQLLGPWWYLTGNHPIVPVYAPYRIFSWYFEFGNVVPKVFEKSADWLFGSILAGMIAFAFVMKKGKVMDSHGSASWAKFDDLVKTGLITPAESFFRRTMRKMGYYQNTKIPKSEGVILGRNPYGEALEGKNFLQHNGPEHIIVMAPTRSGKGVGVIIPTLLTWKHSVFVTDIKGENWGLTAGYRQKSIAEGGLGNRVLKFDPTAQDGSSVKYNPINEVRLRTKNEVRDIQNICDMLVDPNGDAKPDHWSRTAHSLLVGVITHLCYVYHKENRGCPSLSDVASFLSRPDMGIDESLEEMKEYAHVTAEEFLSDKNVFEEIYGEYIKDLNKLKKELKADLPYVQETINVSKNGRDEKIVRNTGELDVGSERLKIYLTHPKVAEAATELQNKPDNEKGSVLSTAVSFLSLYRDPVVAENTSRSEFCIDDLMRDDYPVSLYLVVPPGDLPRLTPLLRMLLNILLTKLTADMQFADGQQVKKKQRCLLLLDEFPALGNMNSMEKGLAFIAGYGLKALLIVQSLNQLNKIYTKDNSIVDNCHVRLFYTPNDSETPGFISKMLGKKTIEVVSRSAKAGGLFDDSNSTSQTGRELMTPEEVGQLPYESSIVFVTGHKPIKGKKLLYFKEKFFTSKTAINAPKVSDKCIEERQEDCS